MSESHKTHITFTPVICLPITGTTSRAGTEAMGKGSRQPARQLMRSTRSTGGGITKPTSALAAAIAARKSAEGAAAVTSSSMAFLEQRASEAIASEGTEGLAGRIMHIVRECVAEAGGRLSFTALGSAARDKAARSGLQQAANGSVRPINGFVKSTWGGWEAFVRSHAGDALRVVDGEVISAESALVAMPDIEATSPSFLSMTERASVSSRDVNALTLDAL